MIDWLNKRGAQVIEVDTDGIYFVPPPVSADSPQRITRANLAKELPPGIEVEFDEQFDAMFSYKAKNYALLTRDGEVIMKGGALKSRGLEKFQRVFLEEIIKLLMRRKTGNDPDLRDDFERKIREREWPIEMLMKTDTLQDSLEKYRQKIAGSARNRAAAYELALASGRDYKPGDQISYYIKATTKECRRLRSGETRERLRPAEPRRKHRLLRRQTLRVDEEVWRRHHCADATCHAGDVGALSSSLASTSLR